MSITALFADLKGSTVLIEGLDLEEARALIDPAVQLMMEAVHRYEGYVALRYAHRPVKQAVISPSALSLMYSTDEIPGYTREQFIQDLLQEHETEIRNCLKKGAHKVQIDFTEGRLAVKIDPSGNLLHSFIDLNNLALARFSDEERQQFAYIVSHDLKEPLCNITQLVTFL